MTEAEVECSEEFKKHEGKLDRTNYRMCRVFESNKISLKDISYSELKPISDCLASYNGKTYGTKQDLKYFPKKVDLVELK